MISNNYLLQNVVLQTYKNIKLISLCVILFTSSAVHALPTGGTVVAGEATIDTQATNMEIAQGSPKAIIDWNTFNIDSAEHVHFRQNPGYFMLNRIVGGNMSTIAGQLSADSFIALINPAGILFQEGAIVDTGGLLATTADCRNEDFLHNKFDMPNSGLDFIQGKVADKAFAGSIINKGNISARDGGLAALVAPNVENHGLITARESKVYLASTSHSSKFTYAISMSGDGLINFVNDRQESINYGRDEHGREQHTVIANEGTLTAKQVILTIPAASTVLDGAINLNGYINASDIEISKGQVKFTGPNLHYMQLDEQTKRQEQKLTRTKEKAIQQFERSTANYNDKSRDVAFKELIIKLNGASNAILVALQTQKDASTLLRKIEQENQELFQLIREKMSNLLARGFTANRQQIAELVTSFKGLLREIKAARKAEVRANIKINNTLTLISRRDDLVKYVPEISTKWQELYLTKKITCSKLDKFNRAIEQLNDEIKIAPTPILTPPHILTESSYTNIPAPPPLPSVDMYRSMNKPKTKNIQGQKAENIQTSNGSDNNGQTMQDDDNAMFALLAELREKTMALRANILWQEEENNEVGFVTSLSGQGEQAQQKMQQKVETEQKIRDNLAELNEKLRTVVDNFTDVQTTLDDAQKIVDAYLEEKKTSDRKNATNRPNNRPGGLADVLAELRSIKRDPLANIDDLIALNKQANATQNRETSIANMSEQIMAQRSRLRSAKLPRISRKSSPKVPPMPTNQVQLNDWIAVLEKPESRLEMTSLLRGEGRELIIVSPSKAQFSPIPNIPVPATPPSSPYVLASKIIPYGKQTGAAASAGGALPSPSALTPLYSEKERTVSRRGAARPKIGDQHARTTSPRFPREVATALRSAQKMGADPSSGTKQESATAVPVATEPAAANVRNVWHVSNPLPASRNVQVAYNIGLHRQVDPVAGSSSPALSAGQPAAPPAAPAAVAAALAAAVPAAAPAALAAAPPAVPAKPAPPTLFAGNNTGKLEYEWLFANSNNKTTSLMTSPWLIPSLTKIDMLANLRDLIEIDEQFLFSYSPWPLYDFSFMKNEQINASSADKLRKHYQWGYKIKQLDKKPNSKQEVQTVIEITVPAG